MINVKINAAVIEEQALENIFENCELLSICKHFSEINRKLNVSRIGSRDVT